jgi:peroxiredoxin Q/BCP
MEAKAMAKVGEVAPDFETTTESGEKFRLSAMRGKRLMLYFYPKDDTPGCTAEACSIRDSYAAFKSNNAMVFGVSGGQVSSHKDFKAKYSLPFPLLMDEDYRIAKLYGVYGPKKLYGKDYRGIERTTFLINQQGKVEGIFGGPEGAEKVDTKEHAQQVIKFWGFKL